MNLCPARSFFSELKTWKTIRKRSRLYGRKSLSKMIGACGWVLIAKCSLANVEGNHVVHIENSPSTANSDHHYSIIETLFSIFGLRFPVVFDGRSCHAS
ncbi:hypothetical protein TNCT_501131 [Trichonephila clavata]|uniref:Uncharacterized protein n=1 Tax=Trichonephila clavata TaxID=2740835 RepID=A0A8X6F410_TRICU|nr:hypothetical protein TNCT_501131 [Trichonephila clavata]